MFTTALVPEFCDKAEQAGAITFVAKSEQEVIDYVLKLCAKNTKNPCQLAIPGLTRFPSLNNNLQIKAKELNITCLNSNLTRYLTGIEVALTPVQVGIAQSGSCMLIADDEDIRLATMISDISILLLRSTDLVTDLTALAPQLKQLQQRASYTTIITGPSRTADIERVLAIGVHGPLELHIILL